uniref:Uncharacterized protein n=1 Tax=Glossina brevipalpis TaxID=37001 RepID=A0A1A9W555_9MUSC
MQLLKTKLFTFLKASLGNVRRSDIKDLEIVSDTESESDLCITFAEEYSVSENENVQYCRPKKGRRILKK